MVDVSAAAVAADKTLALVVTRTDFDLERVYLCASALLSRSVLITLDLDLDCDRDDVRNAAGDRRSRRWRRCCRRRDDDDDDDVEDDDDDDDERDEDDVYREVRFRSYR